MLTVTAGLSSTHAAALLGADGFGDRVRVVDTGARRAGRRSWCSAAASAAADGAGAGEVARRAGEVAGRVRMVGALAGSAHLARSGRVPGLAAPRR